MRGDPWRVDRKVRLAPSSMADEVPHDTHTIVPVPLMLRVLHAFLHVDRLFYKQTKK